MLVKNYKIQILDLAGSYSQCGDKTNNYAVTEKLSELEKNAEFVELAKASIKTAIRYDKIVIQLSTQLETPSTFPLNEFFAGSFKIFFPIYFKWVTDVHMQDENNIVTRCSIIY